MDAASGNGRTGIGLKTMPNQGPGLGDRKMSGNLIVLLVLVLPLALVIAWNVLQSRRIDRHEERIKALESKQ